MQFSNEEEKQIQYESIDKVKAHVEKLESKLGRKPTFCVATFGCQMNAASVIE